MVKIEIIQNIIDNILNDSHVAEFNSKLNNNDYGEKQIVLKCKTSSSARKRGKNALITEKQFNYIDTVKEKDFDKFFLEDLFGWFDVTNWEELSEYVHDNFFDYYEVQEIADEHRWDENDLWSIFGSVKYISNIQYSDGTELKFRIQDNGVKVLDTLTIDDVTYKYGGNDISDNFKYQEKDLSDDELKHRYEVYRDWISDRGFNANDELRNGKQVSSIRDYDDFAKWINDSRCDYDNIVLGHGQKKLYKDDAIGKHIVKTKGHFCTSVGLDDMGYRTFKGYDGWMVYEVIGKNSGAKGLYLSNSVKRFELAEREQEVIFPTNQKRERLLIDEENKIIIEMPIQSK